MAAKVAEINYNIFGGKPKKFIYEDDLCVVFDELQNPQAPVHFLVVPRKVLPRFSEASMEDEKLLGRLLIVAKRVAKMKGLNKRGYRVVMNEGKNGRQTVDQFYVQVMGGRQMWWPFA